MKKNLLILMIFAAVSANVFSQTVIDNLKVSLGNLFDFVIQTGDIKSYEYVVTDNALYGGRVSPRNSISTQYSLQTNVQYIIFAATDLKSEVDLRIYRGEGTSGQPIVQNRFHHAAAIVRFAVPATGTYTIELINLSNQTALVTMLALQVRINPYFSFGPLVSALNSTETVFRERNGSGSTTNNFVFSGKVVPRNGRMNFENIMPEEGRFELLAAGDGSVNTIEAFVIDVEKGETVSRNSGRSSRVDFAVFSANLSIKYRYSVINRSSRNNAAFVIGFVVKN
ncbi:MAG: hypothetical protein FWD14_08605 [Treponema sp.]|nr:hypothetical protein [Treponema sp.]